MLGFFNKGATRHLVVDNFGKYYGIFPSLTSARAVADEIMANEEPPLIISIYKADLIDQVDREPPTKLEDYNSSE